MDQELQFRDWLGINEGRLWDATVAGWTAFKRQLNKPTTHTFESQVSQISTATDALFAVDKFYRMIAPTADARTVKKLEQRLEAAMNRIGYRMHPRQVFEMAPKPPTTR